MSDLRPLPTVIGPTENALRALLCGLLTSTTIQSYERWVALNLVARSAGSGDDLQRQLTDALKASKDAVAEILAGLEVDGLIDSADGSMQLGGSGAAALDQTRPLVSAVTSRLVRDLPPESIETTRNVLDAVRSNAERELADFAGSSPPAN